MPGDCRSRKSENRRGGRARCNGNWITVFFFEFAKLLNSIRLANTRLHFLWFFLNNLPFCRFFGCFRRRFSRIFRCGATFCNKSVKCLRRHIFSARLHFPIRIFLPLKTFQPFILCPNLLLLRKILLNGLHSKPFSMKGSGAAQSIDDYTCARTLSPRHFLFPRSNFFLSA